MIPRVLAYAPDIIGAGVMLLIFLMIGILVAQALRRPT